MTEHNYKNSPEWQKAFEPAKEVSTLTKKLTKSEGVRERAIAQHIYNREAETIVLDIATALGHAAVAQDFLRFMAAAQGATFRLETRLLLDAERNYSERADVETALKLCGELGELLTHKIENLKTAQAARFIVQNRPCDYNDD